MVLPAFAVHGCVRISVTLAQLSFCAMELQVVFSVVVRGYRSSFPIDGGWLFVSPMSISRHALVSGNPVFVSRRTLDNVDQSRLKSGFKGAAWVARQLMERVAGILRADEGAEQGQHAFRSGCHFNLKNIGRGRSWGFHVITLGRAMRAIILWCLMGFDVVSGILASKG